MITTVDIHERLWAVAKQEGERAILDVLQELANEPGEALAAWTVITSEINGLVGVLKSRGASAGSIGGASVLYVPDARGSFAVVCAPSARHDIWHIISLLPATDRRWTSLRSWANRARPRIAPVFLNESDFLRIGDRLSEHGEVSISRMTARKLTDGSSITRGWRRDPHYPSPSHRDVLEEASESSVRTLMVSVGDALRIHLRREAGATFYSGDFGLFVNVILAALADAAGQRRDLLVDRERRVGKPAPKPLVVEVNAGRFDDPKLVGALVETVQRQAPFGVAVLHGNPYLHAVVTDYVDGSNFNVFVAKDDEVRIVPGFRATLESLARLTETIGDRFGAVAVEEASPPPRATLDDLFVEA